METHVFLAVLLAAAFHASWNAMIKLRVEPLLALSLFSIACGAVPLPFVLVVGFPVAAAWPYIFASLAIHMVYYIALAEAYRSGDLGQVYPVARGAAPLMTAIGASLLVGENLGPLGWAGVSVLACGILLLSLKGGRAGQAFEGRSIGFALLTALSIALYTLADGIGARTSGEPEAYIVWLFVIDGMMMAAFGYWRFGSCVVNAEFRQSWRIVLAGGVLSTTAYAIAIWAMTKAPIALVAALRESSVLFAALIGVVVLREPVLPMRVAAALLVVAGIVLIRLR